MQTKKEQDETKINELKRYEKKKLIAAKFFKEQKKSVFNA